MADTVEGPCNCAGPHFHSVVHECCSRLADVVAVLDNTVSSDLQHLRARVRAAAAGATAQPAEDPMITCSSCGASPGDACTDDETPCPRFPAEPSATHAFVRAPWGDNSTCYRTMGDGDPCLLRQEHPIHRPTGFSPCRIPDCLPYQHDREHCNREPSEALKQTVRETYDD